MLTVALERMVGRTKLPGEVRIVAAGNPPDRSAGGLDLTPPMANTGITVDCNDTAIAIMTNKNSVFMGLRESFRQ